MPGTTKGLFASFRLSAALMIPARVSFLPAFLFDHRLLVLGAQPREVFERALAQLEA